MRFESKHRCALVTLSAHAAIANPGSLISASRSCFKRTRRLLKRDADERVLAPALRLRPFTR